MNELKTKIDEKLKNLDAELSAIYETRDILTGRLHTMYAKPYEVVVSFPSSLGERGFRFSMYYGGMPKAEQIYSNFRKELKNYAKDKRGFLGAYKEQAIKIAKKVLKKMLAK